VLLGVGLFVFSTLSPHFLTSLFDLRREAVEECNILRLPLTTVDCPQLLMEPLEDVLRAASDFEFLVQFGGNATFTRPAAFADVAPEAHTPIL
jgi:hypothetical protein